MPRRKDFARKWQMPCSPPCGRRKYQWAPTRLYYYAFLNDRRRFVLLLAVFNSPRDCTKYQLIKRVRPIKLQSAECARVPWNSCQVTALLMLAPPLPKLVFLMLFLGLCKR